MIPPPTVQPLTGDAVHAFYCLSLDTFLHPEDLESSVSLFLESDEGKPGFRPEDRRGVVEAGRFLGGYLADRAILCLGPARLGVACIGGVVTDPEQRRRGIGRAMMDDAIAHAHQRRDALLMLNGIPSFYGRFGYVDIFDGTITAIDRRCIPSHAPKGHRVRPAIAEDATELMSLYRLHNDIPMGAFDWTLEEFRHRLQFTLLRGRGPVVVEDGEGQIQGYLYANGDSSSAYEVEARTWPAALALLQYHAPAAASPSGEQPSLHWRLPPDSNAFYLLAEHLRPPEGDVEAPPLRSVRRTRTDADWMARPAHLPTLVEALVPLWRTRWAGSRRPFTGTVVIRIGGEPFSVHLEDDDVSQANDIPADAARVTLTPGALTQLLFGYRPVRWITSLPGVEIGSDLVPALEVLFPPGGFWLAGTDAF